MSAITKRFKGALRGAIPGHFCGKAAKHYTRALRAPSIEACAPSIEEWDE